MVELKKKKKTLGSLYTIIYTSEIIRTHVWDCLNNYSAPIDPLNCINNDLMYLINK